MDCLRFEDIAHIIFMDVYSISFQDMRYFAPKLPAHFRILLTHINIFYIYVYSITGHHFFALFS